MSQSKLNKLRIVNRTEGKVQTGAGTQVYLDDKLLSGATYFKFEVKAGGVAKVTIELLANVELETELPLELRPTERLERNLKPITQDGKVTGYYSPRYVLGRYTPSKIDQIDKP